MIDRKPTYVRKTTGVELGNRGRKLGSINKTTKDVREIIARIAEKNVVKFQHWLDRVAARDPAEAARIFLRALEYHIPKLARTEVIGALEVTHKSSDEVRAEFNAILAGHGEKVIGEGQTESAAAVDHPHAALFDGMAPALLEALGEAATKRKRKQ